MSNITLPTWAVLALPILGAGGGILVPAGTLVAVASASGNDTVYQPLGIRRGVEQICVQMVYRDGVSVLDGGRDADGGFLDGGSTDEFERTYFPEVRWTVEASMLPRPGYPSLKPVPCGTSFSTSDTDADVLPVLRAVRRVALPRAAEKCHVTVADGGAGGT